MIFLCRISLHEIFKRPFLYSCILLLCTMYITSEDQTSIFNISDEDIKLLGIYLDIPSWIFDSLNSIMSNVSWCWPKGNPWGPRGHQMLILGQYWNTWHMFRLSRYYKYLKIRHSGYFADIWVYWILCSGHWVCGLRMPRWPVWVVYMC